MTINPEGHPVTVSVYFSLTSPFQVLELVLPPGYTMAKEPKLGCGVFSQGDSASVDETQEAKDFSESVKARHLTKYIESCHVFEAEKKMVGRHGDELEQVHVRMSVKHDVPQLSTEQTRPALPESHSNGTKISKPVWWCFAMHVRNPASNPTNKDNSFTLFHHHGKEGWNGEVSHRGWPIYGDWPCKYSDWQGWGQCSARCGTGSMRLTRRLLLEPPSHSGIAAKHSPLCEEPLVKMAPCNQFPCKFPCQLVDTPEAGVCSAECGGGVKAVRSLWRGDNCPAQDDYDSVRFEVCNTKPCRVRCKLADTWTVVTACSEMCGQGTYRMMREVLQKDVDDSACQPEWREVKCVRQWCTQLTVLRPDRNILPYPSDTYYVGIAFKLTFPARKVTLSAPVGYSFGIPGSDCVLHDHDLFPALAGCKVGVHSVDGDWLDARSITLHFKGMLHKSDVGRYHFMLPVKNPGCPGKKFVQVVSVGEEPAPGEICDIPSDQNMWEMQLTRENVAEGRQPILSLWAVGYELHNPEDSLKISTPGGKELFWATTNEAQYLSLEESTWRARLNYCSARLDPCPDGSPCPPSGVCPTPAAAGEDAMLEDQLWAFDDSLSRAENGNLPTYTESQAEDMEGTSEQQ